MSLIHEALKQARSDANAQRQAPQADDFVPVRIPRRRKRGNPIPYVSAIAIGGLLLGVSVALIWYVIATVNSTRSSVTDSPPSTTLTTSLQPGQNSPLPAATAPAAAPKVEPVVDNEPAAAVTSQPPVAAVQEVKKPEPVVVKPPPHPLEDLRGKTIVEKLDHPALGSLQLNAIVWSADNSVALINGAMVRPGDQVGRVTVAAITRKRVKFRAQGVAFYMRMP